MLFCAALLRPVVVGMVGPLVVGMVGPVFGMVGQHFPRTFNYGQLRLRRPALPKQLPSYANHAPLPPRAKTEKKTFVVLDAFSFLLLSLSLSHSLSLSLSVSLPLSHSLIYLSIDPSCFK